MDQKNFSNEIFNELPEIISRSNFNSCTFNASTKFDRCNLTDCVFNAECEFDKSNIIDSEEEEERLKEIEE